MTTFKTRHVSTGTAGNRRMMSSIMW